MVAALEKDDIDIFQAADSKIIKQAEEAGLGLRKTSGSSSMMILMNNSRPPVRRRPRPPGPVLRVDKELINQLAHDGVGVPSYSLFSLDSGYHNPDARTPEYDPDKAKELVDELNGLEFTIACIPDPEAALVLPIIEQLGEEVGMAITVETEDESTYIDRMYANNGDYDAACLRSAEFIEPDTIRPGLRTGDSGNLVFYSNEEVDQLLDEARWTTDVEERVDRYFRVQEILASEVPLLTLVYDVFASVYDERRVGPPPDAEPGTGGAIKPSLLSAAAG